MLGDSDQNQNWPFPQPVFGYPQLDGGTGHCTYAGIGFSVLQRCRASAGSQQFSQGPNNDPVVLWQRRRNSHETRPKVQVAQRLYIYPFSS